MPRASLALAAALACSACSGCGDHPRAKLGDPPEAPIAAITGTVAIARARATHFGSAGYLTGPDRAAAGGKEERLFAAAVDPAGRMIAVGTSQKRAGGNRALILRFALDGSLDKTFGGGDGMVLGVDDGSKDGFEAASVSDDDAFYGVRIDPIGRIVVVGKAGAGGKSKALIARYLSNGAIDPTFGDLKGTGPARVGYVIGMGDEYLDDQFSGVRPESSYPDERLHALELDRAGRIIAVGVTSDLNKGWLADSDACNTWLPQALCRSGFYTTLITRWTPDGHLDTSFNRVGYRTGTGGRGPWWTGRHDELLDVRQLEGGRIVAAGFVTGDTPEARRSLIVAYTSDGNLDDEGFNSTDTPGYVLGPERSRAGGSREEIHSLAIDGQGKIIAAGASWDARKTPRALIARYLPNGVLDPSFAEAGWALEDIAPEKPSVRATIDEQGQIVASTPPHTVRFTTSGAIDDRFTTSSSASVAIHDLLADRFGKIWFIGGRGTSWLVARYGKNGCLDKPGECTTK